MVALADDHPVLANKLGSLSVQVNVPPLQRKQLTQAHAGFQSKDDRLCGVTCSGQTCLRRRLCPAQTRQTETTLLHRADLVLVMVAIVTPHCAEVVTNCVF